MTSVKYDYSFISGFLSVDNELVFNSYNLMLHLYVNESEDEDQQIAFARMDFFISDIIDNAVFINENDIESIERFQNAGLRVLTVEDPGPIDQIIQVTIINKLNLITSDILQIFESEISSNRGGYIKYLYYSNTEIENDFELISQDSKKWWNISTPKFVNIEATEIYDFKDAYVNWQSFDLEWSTDKTELPIDANTISNIINLASNKNEN